MKPRFIFGIQRPNKSPCNENTRALYLHTQPSAGKIMAFVFWDSKGVILIDYLVRGSTITGKYYADQITKLRRAIEDKCRGKLTQRVLLLHDNTPVHKARVAQARIHDCDFQQLNHQPYSSDLAPSDFHLFRHLKKHLRGHRFADDNQPTGAVEGWFEG